MVLVQEHSGRVESVVFELLFVLFTQSFIFVFHFRHLP